MKTELFTRHWIVMMTFLLLLAFNVQAGTIEDSESATHDYSAAAYNIEDTHEYHGFNLIQINLGVLSHYSYILESDGEALIVDPGRDVQFYLDTTKSHNLKIVGVFLTHSHADFVAGHLEIAKATGCPIYQSSKSNAQYAITPVEDGSKLNIGKARIKILDTPGHVVDGQSALVYSPGQKEPVVMLSGDFLFVGSVGRPDLVKDTTSAALAGALYDTWTQKISKLPDDVEVFPAHGAGSLCGANLGDDSYTSIGDEREDNPYLQYTSRSAFITAVLSGLSKPPQYFPHNAAMNMQGPEVISQQPALPEKLAPDLSLTQVDKYTIVDIRDEKSFAKGHIPNSVNIPLRGRFELWTGMVIPWQTELVLSGDERNLQEAFQRLHRIGYSGKYVLFEEWQKAGLAQFHNTLISPKELHAAMQAGTEPMIIDVRLPKEWEELRIGNVLNLPLTELDELSAKLDKETPVVAVCNSAYRSNMAIGLLERKGFKNVTSLDGGSQAWIQAGYSVFGSEAEAVTETISK